MPQWYLFDLGGDDAKLRYLCVVKCHGEVTEVRCNHPTVELMRMSEEVPDWIIDKNTFRPSAGQDCGAWRARRNEAPVTA